MILKRKALPRRTFLRGLGTAVALPFLDAMVPALAGNLYPVPEGPYGKLPYIYLAYLAAGLLWFLLNNRNKKAALA